MKVFEVVRKFLFLTMSRHNFESEYVYGDMGNPWLHRAAIATP